MHKGQTRLEWMLAAIKAHGDSDECLLWPFTTIGAGYGTLSGFGKVATANAVAFHITHGRWPEGDAMHSCDTPRCFNPKHIFEGNRSANMLDSVSRGRLPRGERHWHARLTADDVRAIRSEYIPRVVTTEMLGRKYGVGSRAITKILLRQKWKHV